MAKIESLPWKSKLGRLPSLDKPSFVWQEFRRAGFEPTQTQLNYLMVSSRFAETRRKRF